MPIKKDSAGSPRSIDVSATINRSNSLRSATENNSEDSMKPSSLTLEPNPFEQSFASTKKPVTASNSTAGSPTGVLGSYRIGSSVAANNRVPYPKGVANSFSNPLFSGQRPVIQSPPILTPNVSKKLPPLVPPNYNHQSPTDEAMTITVPRSNNGSNTGTTPGFLSYLPRTGLTPNESSMRSGLTPGSINSNFNYPLLPSLSSGGAGATTSAAVLNTAVNLNINKNGVINPLLTPGISAILGYSNFTSTNNNLSTSPAPLFKTMQPTNGSPEQDIEDSIKEEDKDTIYSKKSGLKRKLSVSSLSNRRPNKKNLTDVPITATEDTSGTSTLSGNSEVSIRETPEEQERRRKEFLERNRVAASKFRKRKKEYIKKIEGDIRFYEEEYNQMSDLAFKLMPVDNITDPSSILSLLEQSISNNDVNTSLTLVNHIKQLLIATRLYQRKGINPIEDDNFEEPMKKSTTKKKLNDKSLEIPRSKENSTSLSPSISTYLSSIMPSDPSTSIQQETIQPSVNNTGVTINSTVTDANENGTNDESIKNN